jgi:hypothetical protein
VTARRRGLEDLLADLAEAVDAAAEIVGSGKQRWDAERPLRLAALTDDVPKLDRAVRQ